MDILSMTLSKMSDAMTDLQEKLEQDNSRRQYLDTFSNSAISIIQLMVKSNS